MWLSRRWVAAAAKTSAIALNRAMQQCTTQGELERLVAANADQLNDIHISTGLHMLHKQLGASSSANCHRLLLESISTTKAAFTPRSLTRICTTLSSSSPGGSIPPGLLAKLPTPMEMAKSYSPRQLSSLAWALAKTRQRDEFLSCVRPGVLLAVNSNSSTNRLSEFTAQDLAMLLWSFASLGDDSVLQPVCQELLLRRRQRRDVAQGLFSAQDLAYIAWSLATTTLNKKASSSVTGEGVMDWIEQECEERRSSGDGMPDKSLAMLIWSFAKLNRRVPAALLSMCLLDDKEKQQRWSDPRSVLNVLWALTTQQHNNNPSQLLAVDVAARLGEHMTTRTTLRTLSGQDFSALVWSLACLRGGGEGGSATWDALALEATQRDLSPLLLLSSSSSDFSRALWAFAVMDRMDVAERFASALLKQQEGQRGVMSNQSLSTILWSLGELRYKHMGVLDALVLRKFDSTNTLTLPDCQLIIKSLAVLRYSNPPVLHRVLQRALSLLVKQEEEESHGRRREVLNLLWSCACLDVLHWPEARALADLVDDDDGVDEEEEEANMQRLQIRLAWGSSTKLPAWLSRPTTTPLPSVKTSTRQTRVAALLRQHLKEDVTPLEEETTVLGGLSVDILLPSVRCVVEVDGPQHFYSNLPATPTGATEFKRRLLTRAGGYRVFSVSASDFTRWSVEQRDREMAQLAKEMLKAPTPTQQFTWSVKTRHV